MTDDHDPALPAEDPLGLEALWRLVEKSPRDSLHDILVGSTLGDVEILRLIAEGGMGRVYEGLQNAPRRAVAVKVLRPGPAARASVRRFLQEAQILGGLRHPGICHVHAAGTFEAAGTELPYFVMELIPDGIPITEYVRRHALSVSDRLSLFGIVCDAVAHAHARGVVHRDLKPANIVVDASGQPRVIDFGIARGGTNTADLTALTMTGTGQLLGTIQYMSPEQVEGDGALVDARTDVYALGLILHELLSGKPAHAIAGAPLLEAIRIIQEDRLPPVSISGSRTAGVSLVIDKCVDKDRRRRYADAGELVADLRRRFEADGDRLIDRARVLTRQVRNHAREKWPTALAVIAGSLLALLTVVSRDWKALFNRLGVGRVPEGFAEILGRGEATLPFRYSFTSVLDQEADRYLVSAENVVKWNDPREELRVNYWGPSQNDVEGVLVYRFRFPGRSARVAIVAETGCWDFLKHHTGFGRGVSAIEVSRDGVTWTTIQDDIQPRRWGVNCRLNGDLPADVLGVDELWLRVRLLTDQAEPRAGYTVAQFCRSVPAEGRTVFSIEADCVPPDESR